MKKACVVGHFGYGEELLNGQTIKTKSVTQELIDLFGQNQVDTIDTHGGLSRFPLILLRLLFAFVISENIIILPAHNGIKVIVPICSLLQGIFHRRVHYVVIGGWLPQWLGEHSLIDKQLKYFKGIYVETNTMRTSLEARGFSNVFVLPNFKTFDYLLDRGIGYSDVEPLKLCTMSRVMREKGIEEAISVVSEINRKYGKTVFCLDIYGQVDHQQIEWFDELKKHFPSYISYKGNVPYDKTVSVVKDYFALLFPTRFYTEGIPGTIIDAYAAGVPVISARWESFNDIICEGITGLGYDFDNQSDFLSTLEMAISDRQRLIQMRARCCEEARKYCAEEAIKILISNM